MHMDLYVLRYCTACSAGQVRAGQCFSARCEREMAMDRDVSEGGRGRSLKRLDPGWIGSHRAVEPGGVE